MFENMSFIMVLELVGVISASVSGCLVAIKKDMDLFGIIILGIITSVGGGVIRDLIIGNTPPFMFQNPIFVLASSVVAVLVIVVMKFHLYKENKTYEHLMEKLFFTFDTIGLASFTIDGVIMGQTMVGNPTIFLSVFLGVVTGVGGGVLRDITVQEIPGIFVKHIYAVAAIAGAVTTAVLWKVSNKQVAALAGILLIIIIRYLAAKYRWNLPKVGKK